MRTTKAAALCGALLLLATGLKAGAATKAGQTALHLVEKIYIGEMGSTDEATRFRLLLEDKLTERGFTVVDKAEKADALLSGALSVSPGGAYGRSDVAVTVRLVSAGGERLWSINLPKPVTFAGAFKVRGLRIREPVEYRADELARELREDWERSARGANPKPKK